MEAKPAALCGAGDSAYRARARRARDPPPSLVRYRVVHCSVYGTGRAHHHTARADPVGEYRGH
jgi:hypothetical protein